jgi:hypothetical protein
MKGWERGVRELIGTEFFSTLFTFHLKLYFSVTNQQATSRESICRICFMLVFTRQIASDQHIPVEQNRNGNHDRSENAEDRVSPAEA